MKQTAQIFLCYAGQDETKVSALYEKLSLAGFQPFMAPKDILPGEDWKLKLLNTIREAPFFLACLSNNSVDKRGMIQEEIREALDVWRQKLDSDIYFIPVRFENCRVPNVLAKFQWVDLFQVDGFERLQMAIDIGMERLGIIRPIRLRTRPLDYLSVDNVKLMLQGNDFFSIVLHSMGKGIRHQYELLEEGRVVFDKTTYLIWQQSGSEKAMYFRDSEKYIHDLNEQHFARCTDWRLPTLEEAMSLMEPKKYGKLYLDSIFDQQQGWIWTADKESASLAWTVSFHLGYCSQSDVHYYGYVRAVR